MLGKEDPQGGLFEAASQLDENELQEMGLYGRMAKYGSDLFDDEDFAHLYDTENERPSTPPSLLARARLLQHYEDISEREVVRRCKYDLRWKVALGLDLQTTENPFARTTFQAFRYRLTMHDEEGLVSEKSIERARKVGLLEDELEVALDVEQLAETHEVSRHLTSDSIKGSELVDWDDEEAVDDFLAGLLEDAYRVVELARESGAGGAEIELLERIIDEDVDVTAPSEPKGEQIEESVERIEDRSERSVWPNRPMRPGPSSPKAGVSTVQSEGVTSGPAMMLRANHPGLRPVP
ncbi:MAG: transposase [Bradymonadaceae bacterium]